MPKRDTPKVCNRCEKEFWFGTNSSFCEQCRFIEKTCKVCGKLFITNRCHNTETCSNKCGANWRWRNAEQERANRRPPCSNCGKPITRKYIRYGKAKATDMYCSVKCMGEGRKGHYTGKNSPSWKGGYDGYYGPLWRKQRAKVRKRDKVCQCCGKTPKKNGKALDVHHIIPFRKFGIERAKEAHNLNNLICYCVSCHQIIEWEENGHS